MSSLCIKTNNDEILAYLNGEDYKKEKLDDSSKRILNKKEENEIFDWLNDVIAKGVEYLPLQELRCKAIFPNQKGILKPEQWMKKDMTPDEVLKEIAFCFAAESPECD